MTNSTFDTTRRGFLVAAAGSGAGLALGAHLSGALAQQPAATPLKISTIGAGREGSALGTLFAKAGHPVMFSSRHPEALKSLVDGLGPLARAGTVAEAVDFGDVVLLVIPFTAMEQIGKEYGAALAKKPLLIDVSNPIARRDGADFVKTIDGLGGPGVATAKWLPGARIVRAFNAIGSGKLSADAHRQGELVAVPIAGDDKAALDLASKLIREIGFEPVVVGGAAMGKHLVPGTPLAGEHTAAEIRAALPSLR